MIEGFFVFEFYDIIFHSKTPLLIYVHCTSKKFSITDYIDGKCFGYNYRDVHVLPTIMKFISDTLFNVGIFF